ncbi:hypothetical protein MHN80_10830 [Gordonia McavH-238-E]|nr:hypothetical protein [Gordonia sp. McavH-238-E]MCG7632807.1 hypothetical protein [Gordonia sp. McavH-238-E]
MSDLVTSGAADRLREDEAKLFLDVHSQVIVVEETESDCTVKQDLDL